MADPVLVREWIDKADNDFGFAEVNLKERRDYFPQICFHFQQAAEKYLKAFIVAFDLEFKKTHDFDLLYAICKVKEPSFEGIREDLEFLNGFYVETRYPVHWPAHYTVEESGKAYQAAARVKGFVKKQLVRFLQ